MKRKEKGNTHSIRALVNPRSVTMVSIALLVHRSSRRKEDSSRESKEIKERKGKSMQIEKEKNSSNPNPRGKGPPDLPGPCATHGRTCAGPTSTTPHRGGGRTTASRRSPSGTPEARARARAQGTAARPLDGGAPARAEHARRRGGRRRRRPRSSPAAMDARAAAASRGERKGRGE